MEPTNHLPYKPVNSSDLLANEILDTYLNKVEPDALSTALAKALGVSLTRLPLGNHKPAFKDKKSLYDSFTRVNKIMDKIRIQEKQQQNIINRAAAAADGLNLKDL